MDRLIQVLIGGLLCAGLAFGQFGEEDPRIVVDFSTGTGSHRSDIINQDVSFTDYSGVFIRINNEEIPVKYRFVPLFLNFRAGYFMKDNVSAGLRLQYFSIQEFTDYPSRIRAYEVNEHLMHQLSFGPQVEYWMSRRFVVGLSAGAGFFLSRGKLQRLSVLTENYDVDDELRLFLDLQKDPVSLQGWGYEFHTRLTLNGGRTMPFIAFSYQWVKDEIQEDGSVQYIRVSRNMDRTVNFGIMFRVL